MPLLGTGVICPSPFVTKTGASGSLRRVARRLDNPESDKVASKFFSAAVLQAMLAPLLLSPKLAAATHYCTCR